MIKVIYGMKGSGKTKRILDAANNALKTQNGNVVFIDDDNRYMYDLRHEVRFVNAADYHIENADMLLGFLAGMMSQNFDIGVICVDAFLKLVKIKVEDTKDFFARLGTLAQLNKVEVIFSVSGDPEKMPEHIKPFLI